MRDFLDEVDFHKASVHVVCGKDNDALLLSALFNYS